MIGEPAAGAAQCTIDEVDAAQWHRLIQHFDDGCIQQTWCYAAARWPRARLSHLVVSGRAGPLAAAQVAVLRVPLLGSGLAYVHFGPMWRPRGAPRDASGLGTVIRCLHEEYVARRGLLLRVKPNAEPARPSGLEEYFAALGFACRRDPSPDRFFVDLSLPPAQLRAGLHPKWRYNLKRSERHGFEIEHREGEPALRAFLDLYASMLRRKAFDDSSAIGELPAFYAGLPPALRPHIVLCSLRGEPVAGVVVSRIGDTALYLFGASDERAQKVCAGYYLHWAVIEWLRTRGCRWYDLGGDSGSAGLRQFKTGLVGKCGRIAPLPGDFECARGLASRVLVGAALGLRDAYRGSRALLARGSP